MIAMGTIWSSMFTPRLIKLHGYGPDAGIYQPNAVENVGDRMLQSAYIFWKFGIYTSPLLCSFLYKRGYFCTEGYIQLTQLAMLMGSLIAVSYITRAIGRANNQIYQTFTSTLTSAHEKLTGTNKQQLSVYEFDFKAWPIEFRWSDLERDEIKQRLYIKSPSDNRTLFQIFASLPCHILSYIAVRTFGIRLIYPGSLSVFQYMICSALRQGRSRMIDTLQAERYKLETKEKNQIDSIVIDRRNTDFANGKILVVCCEGNAGFYEIGIASTPLAAGYSVLGWNHPGFAESTGSPYPEQELNAMDTVMQFAIRKLGFRVENIVVFGWSIGGFTASWAAMNYPDIKGLILDASFDDLLPLALNSMPAWSESIVRLAIRDHVNLNNIEQLVKYPGPVLLIRRSQDEVICLEPGEASTNRGNFLLTKLLKYRYPIVMGEEQQAAVNDFLKLTTAASREQFVSAYNVKNEETSAYVNSYMSKHPKMFPSRLGETVDEDHRTHIALFLVRKYFRDYRATHCTPLPAEMFHMPWEAIAD